MEKNIKVIVEGKNQSIKNYLQGSSLEQMVKNIIEAHQYTVGSNINFTGMEIDLIASHNIREEKLYVECKAKENLSSADVKSFSYNVYAKKADFGYFISTSNFDHQVAGIIDEQKNDSEKRYKNLTYINPEKFITILIEAKKIKKIDTSNIIKGEITKEILAVTYFGDYFVMIESENILVPTNFYLFDAKSGELIDDKKTAEKLQSEILEIKNLNFVGTKNKIQKNKKGNKMETISEINESKDWFDYLPTSSKYFVGRESERKKITQYFNDILENKSDNRIFCITGKSGWGKSSFVSEIRGRCRNKYYKNRFFTLAIDSRSAQSQNFIALSVDQLISKAKKEKFIKFDEKIKLTTSQDILSSRSIKSLLDYLKKNNKLLILIFDQFEDVFRREELFKSFYQFLIDVGNAQSNLLLGFSWKKEHLISPDNDIYHLWQQAKEQVMHIDMPGFGSQEIGGVIKQLEKSIGKIPTELKRKIIEGSQGFPWLTKKLCIHIFNQYKAGKRIENLLEENLNIKQLFENDKEDLKKDELIALKYIAERSESENFFEEVEINDKITENTINSLRDKRLIVKSGANYNVYWDIFRDYLLTEKIPLIGEGYILRQTGNMCLGVYLLFRDHDKLDVQTIIKNIDREKPYSVGVVENILRDLINIGLIRKESDSEMYKLKTGYDTNISEENFIKYITEKFKSYTPYLKIIQREEYESLSSVEIVEVFEDTFRGVGYSKKTWNQYAATLISWFKISNLKVSDKIIDLRGRGNRNGGQKLRLFKNPKKDIEVLKTIIGGSDKVSKQDYQSFLDLKSLKLIDGSKEKLKLTALGKQMSELEEVDFNKELARQSHKFYQIEVMTKYLMLNPKSSFQDAANKLSNSLLKEINTKSSKNQTAYLLHSWATFIIKHLGEELKD